MKKIALLICLFMSFNSVHASELDDATKKLNDWGRLHQKELNEFFKNNPDATSYFRWIFIGHNKYVMVFPLPPKPQREGCFETAQGWQKGYMPGNMHVNDDCS